MEDSNKPPRPRNSRKRTTRKPKNRRGMPQPPQVKVTIRKIDDLERFGSVSSILNMTKTIINKTNDENKYNKMYMPIQLDEASVERLVVQEKLVEAAKAAAAQETAQEENPAHENETEEVTNEQENVVMEEEVSSKQVNEKSDAKFAAVVKGSQEQTADAIKGPVIAARALYVIPPKNSRRRGIKSGCAYLVLTGPSVAPSEEEYANMAQGEKSRVTAKARLQLSTAVEALSNLGEEDAKTRQEYGGCVIQQSISGKAWKANYYDNREGTIETTADYKRFMTKTEKEEEDRMSRPRPTPGGAMMGDVDGGENEQQVAAIVLHLQAKRKQEARRRKASAKMANGGVDPKPQNKSKKPKDDSTKGSRRSRREGKKKGGGKRKEKSPPKPAPMPAPVMSAAEFPTL